MKIFQYINICLLLQLTIISYGQNKNRPQAVPFNDFTEAKSYLDQQSENNLFSGAVLVQSKNNILVEKAYGMADKQKEIPNNINTKFNIGSINKVFTSVCVMQLVEAGKIKLEDKITKYIPELKMPMADEISIKHLLEMKSGLGSYWDSDLFRKRLKKLYDIEDYLPIINEYELSSKPGTEWQYSNSGYELLGILVQRVSKENYYDYVRKNVYKKAGMNNTDAFERNKNINNLAYGYTNYVQGEALNPAKPGSYEQNIKDWQPIKGTAAGGGYSTLKDLYRFLTALNNNKLLSQEHTDMVINRFKALPKRKNVHSFRGGSYGTNAIISYNITKETAVIVLSNYDPPTATIIARRLTETIDQGSNETNKISDIAEIQQVIEQFKECIENKNLNQFVSLFAEEETVSWIGNGSFGVQNGSPSSFIKMLQTTNKSYREDFHNVIIWHDDLIATVTFDYGFFGDNQLSNWGKESWMLIKKNSKWKITNVNFSMILPHQKKYPYE